MTVRISTLRVPSRDGQRAVSKAGSKARTIMPNATHCKLVALVVLLIGSIVVGISCSTLPKGVTTNPAVRTQKFPRQEFDDKIDKNSHEMLAEGRKIFRYDSFGSEAYWGDQLQLHRAILREKKGGVGAGISARKALQLGLKAD